MSLENFFSTLWQKSNDMSIDEIKRAAEYVTTKEEEKMALASGYYRGINGISQKYSIAVKYYRKAVQSEDAEAQYWFGDSLYWGCDGVEQNRAEAVSWFRKSADQGNANAQGRMGICYYYGCGLSQNYAEAVKWLLLSVSQGNNVEQDLLEECFYLLGECHYKGEGVAQDYTEAVKWYRKAAELWNADALKKLGDCYFKGEGVRMDYKEAVNYWDREEEQRRSEDFHCYPSRSQYDNDYDNGRHYDEYAGTYAQDVEGYSDEFIDDVLDGAPDACWNID